MSGLIDLAGDESRKAPLVISIGRLMHVDYWIGGDSFVCIRISSRAASEGSVEKLRCLLPSLDMSIFYFHGEDSG
jgi:hypothetical protein